jgi:tetratricopeptide (TPR) repeat protein
VDKLDEWCIIRAKPKQETPPMSWNQLAPTLLALLILGCLGFILLASWPVVQPTVISAATLTAEEKEGLLKEKLDNYSKRADELQKVGSLLLGLSTIYAITLGIAAYTSVQGNIDQAKRIVEEAKDWVKKLETLTTAFETLKNTEIENLRKEIKSAHTHANYATRIAVATMISEVPPSETEVATLRKATIQRLIELRDGDSEYATDRLVNLHIASLYLVLDDFEKADKALAEFIRQLEKSPSRDVAILAEAYYNKACYQSLHRAKIDNAEEKEVLADEIRRNLKRAFEFDEPLRRHAQTDTDLINVRTET